MNPRKSVRWLAVALLILVIVQGVLGGVACFDGRADGGQDPWLRWPRLFRRGRWFLRGYVPVVDPHGRKSSLGSNSQEFAQHADDDRHVVAGRQLWAARDRSVSRHIAVDDSPVRFGTLVVATYRNRRIHRLRNLLAVDFFPQILFSNRRYPRFYQLVIVVGGCAIFAGNWDLGRQIWLASLV